MWFAAPPDRLVPDLVTLKVEMPQTHTLRLDVPDNVCFAAVSIVLMLCVASVVRSVFSPRK